MLSLLFLGFIYDVYIHILKGDGFVGWLVSQVVLNGTHASAPALAFSAEPLDQAGGEGPYSQQTSLMPITLTVIAMTFVVKIDTIRAYLSKVNAPAITGEDWVPSKTAAAAVRSKPLHKRK